MIDDLGLRRYIRGPQVNSISGTPFQVIHLEPLQPPAELLVQLFSNDPFSEYVREHPRFAMRANSVEPVKDPPRRSRYDFLVEDDD